MMPEDVDYRPLVTFQDELRLGVRVDPKQERFLLGFYESLDEDWLEREYTPLWFQSEFEKYEWLFKRAMAGYLPGPEEFKFMHQYEESPEYKTHFDFRYEQLKQIYADELRPVFGTLHKRRKPQ